MPLRIWLFFSVSAVTAAAAEGALETFQREIEPVLAKYCFDCHGNGVDKGGVRLDGFGSEVSLRDPALWWRALKNVRSGMMPPADEEHLPRAQAEKLMQWIKREAFGLDSAQPDPGRVTVRRLNRLEYRNTVRELTGFDYDTQKEFPADDTGHGFDNIADVLTLSPMLLEKYLDAAQFIVAQTVPLQSRIVAETPVPGRQFLTVKVDTTVPALEPAAAVAAEALGGAAVVAPTVATVVAPGKAPGRSGRGQKGALPPSARPVPVIVGDELELSYYTPATVAAKHRVTQAGSYQVKLDLRAVERYADEQFDQNRCRLTFAVDGEILLDQEFLREGSRKFEFIYDREWGVGEHEFVVTMEPVAPARPQLRQLRMRVNAVVVRGPLAEEFWVKPPGYSKFFAREIPQEASERRAYARELLEKFATRAYRRPVEPGRLERLVDLAEGVSTKPRATFASGIAQAMSAVLSSPSFIFREDRGLPIAAGERYPRIDEYSLASRLSYFFWSSMPDAELLRLAGAGQLRANLTAQVSRLVADPRGREWVQSFAGQWLQARDITNVPITALDIYLRDHPSPEYEEARQVLRRGGGRSAARTPEQSATAAKAREVLAEFNRTPKPELTGDLRRAMLQETEMTFAHILREDRSLLELIESDYTFLNEELAKHYGIPGVTGRQLRQVTLPPDSPRGGILTQGTILTVTSNPTRTSPVKRGLFILEAILGTPPAPPPPNIPSLEESAVGGARPLSLRETMARHAKEPLCHSCHSRMDPLGLALENFNAMGQWRESELGEPIKAEGKLLTGETFTNIRELKHILATQHQRNFYYNLSEKLLTYALGRGLEFYDVGALDRLVDTLEAGGGKPSAWLLALVNSVPFQQQRPAKAVAVSDAAPKPDRATQLSD